MKNDCLPKKILGLWVLTACKSGRPWSDFKENFIQALKSVLKENISNDAKFKEDWLPMAEDEEKMEHNTQHPLQEPKQSKSK